ncbi:DNA-directed RNA polymerase subunit L [Candidatus Bathyarchaeota archaeon]|nr:MAG: DNA-directed RNA polymerase subunit L [Candidatus Bathyarchaeota archaeon]HDM88616.1 DNA-directed RNA polymerase subunit L [Candidatus Bathyarchaeota archaeon]
MRRTTMELRVLRRTSNELKIEIEGEGHTFCNLLESVLLEDKMVEFAGYDVPHPLISNAIFFIRTKEGKRPEKALIEAIEKIRRKGKELSREFNNALKMWSKEKRQNPEESKPKEA